MARIRLLQLGGSIAPFVHEAKLNRALADCPTSDPWCAIAEADWELFLPPFTGADPRRVPAILADSPLPAAAARIGIATGVPPTTTDLGGMGQGIAETGRLRPPAPGTWVLGVGVGGAPGAGIGLTVRFVHPDLAWKAHRLELVGGGDTRGGVMLSGTLVTATRPGIVAWAGGSRSVADQYVNDSPVPYSLLSARVGAAVAPRVGPFSLQVGASAREDVLNSTPSFTAGPNLSLSTGDPFQNWLRLGADTGFGGYTHAAFTFDGRLHPDLAGGTLAARLAVTHVPTDSPFYRLPTAGGTDVLRGLPSGRFRGPTVAVAQLEYRHPLIGPLEGALFVDTAHVDGWHLTGGGGIRLVLPPDRWNVTRLDIGVGPEGWGVVAAWGEAF